MRVGRSVSLSLWRGINDKYVWFLFLCCTQETYDGIGSKAKILLFSNSIHFVLGQGEAITIAIYFIANLFFMAFSLIASIEKRERERDCVQYVCIDLVSRGEGVCDYVNNQDDLAKMDFSRRLVFFTRFECSVFRSFSPAPRLGRVATSSVGRGRGQQRPTWQQRLLEGEQVATLAKWITPKEAASGVRNIGSKHFVPTATFTSITSELSSSSVEMGTPTLAYLKQGERRFDWLIISSIDCSNDWLLFTTIGFLNCSYVYTQAKRKNGQ